MQPLPWMLRRYLAAMQSDCILPGQSPMCYQGGVGMLRTYAITVVVIIVVVCACKFHRRSHVQSIVTSSLRSVPLLGRLGRLAWCSPQRYWRPSSVKVATPLSLPRQHIQGRAAKLTGVKKIIMLLNALDCCPMSLCGQNLNWARQRRASTVVYADRLITCTLLRQPR